MAKRSKGAKRTRHDARKWVLKALESSPGSQPMLTSEIMSRVASLSGAKIPGYSIYQALRTLVKRKTVSSRRRGRELIFSLGAAPKSVKSTPRAAPAPEMPAMEMTEAPAEVTSVSVERTFHTIAPGEVTILHIGEEHIETASNVHGKIVLEKHRRPTH